ncbi:hypothetical protein ABIC33_005608 [Variovorax sp. 1140]
MMNNLKLRDELDDLIVGKGGEILTRSAHGMTAISLLKKPIRRNRFAVRR